MTRSGPDHTFALKLHATGKNVTGAVYEFAQFSDIREAFRRAKQKPTYDRCCLIEIP